MLDYGDVKIDAKGKYIIKELARDERMINYNNLFFKSGDPNIDNYDLLKRFCTLHGFLIDLLKEKINIKAGKEQNEMLKKK